MAIIGLIVLSGIALAVIDVPQTNAWVNSHRTQLDLVRIGLLSCFTAGYLLVRRSSIRTQTNHGTDYPARVVEARLLAWLWLIELLVGQRLLLRFGDTVPQ